MKITAFPNPMLRIAIGILAVLFVAYLLEIPLFFRQVVQLPETLQDFHAYQFQKETSYTLYINQLSEGLTFIFIPQQANVFIKVGESVGPDLSAPQARLRQKLPRGEARLAKQDVISAGMSATITPQPVFVDPKGKEVAFMVGP